MHQVMRTKVTVIVGILICSLAIVLVLYTMRVAAIFENSVERFIITHIIDWQRKNRPGEEFQDDFVIITHNKDWRIAIGKVVLLQRRTQHAWKWDWDASILTEVSEADIAVLTDCRENWQFHTNRLTPYEIEVVIEAIYPRCGSLLLSRATTTWWVLDHKSEPWSMTQRVPGGSTR